jgi:hypothetical protein
MGTWSTSILGNDNSSDVNDHFMNQYYDGTPLEKIKQSVASKFGLDEAKPAIGEAMNYWLGYAWALCEVNLLTKEVSLIVQKIITSGADLKEWKELGASEDSLADREVVTKDFLEKVLLQSKKSPRKDVIEKRKKKKKEKEHYSVLKAGQIFKFPMHLDLKTYMEAMKTEDFQCAEWGYGRVLLNEHYQRTNKEIENNPNYSKLFKNGIWVELYRETSKWNEEIPDSFTVLIPSISVSGARFDVVGYKKVEVEKIVFRETIANFNELFIGELRIKFPRTNEVDDVAIYPGSMASVSFDKMVLANSGRESEIEVNPNYHKLENIDFRFHPYRDKILKSANIDPNYNYYELSLQYGIDLKRLYLDAR